MIILSIASICLIMLFGGDALDRYEREHIRWERRWKLREETWTEVKLIEFCLPYEA